MSSLRWLFFLSAIALGAAAGVYYGWVVSPVEYVDTTPATLREDYRADYCLMTAELYAAERAPQAAARRLASLGGSPVQRVAEALLFARQYHYAPTDIALLEDLSLGLQAWQPLPANP
jgi:hypothetical protein